MNPWMDEQLGAAHRADQERAARRAGVHDGLGHPDRGPNRRPPTAEPAGTAARRRVGRLLVRAGTRLGGLEVLVSR